MVLVSLDGKKQQRSHYVEKSFYGKKVIPVHASEAEARKETFRYFLLEIYL